MNKNGSWISDLSDSNANAASGGMVRVSGYSKQGRPPEEVSIMEKAAAYEAAAVFFEAPRDGKPPVAQAFVYTSDGTGESSDFARKHQQLWSWGGVPLVYRATPGSVQLFRCAHRPDFEHKGQIVCRPFQVLKTATDVAGDPWWDEERLRNGTLWDDPQVCRTLLSSNQAAQKTLIGAIKNLHDDLEAKGILPKFLRRRLLTLSVLIAYLEARRVFEGDYFSRFKRGADKFFHVLADGPALVALLKHLEKRFNGNVFTLTDNERQTLQGSGQLGLFAQLVEGRQERSGQLTLWQRYSFTDLPVELISHIYQLFVKDADTAVYTPHFVVKLMLAEALSWKRLDRLEQNDEVILDGACGSGIFLVEAYKRLILHWRYRNDWRQPNQTTLKKLLVSRIRGVDIEEGAVEMAAFSLCLTLCDALDPAEIRMSVKLFPPLKEKTIHTSCFFAAAENGILHEKIGVVVGNPPFASALTTEGARRAHETYVKRQGALPDRQLAYLFLNKSMELLTPGGILAMLQQYNFLYNQQSLGFRQNFIKTWELREVLDFVSVRGLFQKGGADTKVIVIVAEAQAPPNKRPILHATFRRSGRVDAQQGFDLDYYDMHWLSRDLVLRNDAVWRTNLLGGGRALAFVDRLKKFRTLGKYAEQENWDYGEGFVEGASGVSRPAAHITGKPLLPSTAINDKGITAPAIETAKQKPIEGPRSPKRFTPPMLLVREHMDLFHGVWTKSYLTYKNKTVGFCAPPEDLPKIQRVEKWLKTNSTALRAYVAATSIRLFTQKATTLSSIDVEALPYPENHTLKLSKHEELLTADMVDHYRDLIRLGEDSPAMKNPGLPALDAFNEIFLQRICGVYKSNRPAPAGAFTWQGIICQPYTFGKAKVDWTDSDQLRKKINLLLKDKHPGGIHVTRIARLYDGPCIFLIKPDRLRYWLKSVALRDADEVLADLAEQGF
jgi:hypothetical protein